MHPIEVLERYWNYTAFRPHQEAIITSVLNNEDTFALLPTGGGKSICFQIPALIKEGICIVISPLVALMKDQVNQLKKRDIKAIALTSGLSYSDLDTQLDNCIYGNYKFLYLSPERLQQPLVQERIQQMNVNLIAVDEAHCISQWGNDFRPAYKNIITLRALHPHVSCIALTATAKSEVIKDTITALDFLDPKVFKASFKRPNIVYNILHTDDKKHQLKQILKTHKGSSIVYVRNRKASIELSTYLEQEGFSTTYYHGGITHKEKTERLQLWSTNQKRIIIATTAFGMGIDKPDVETVIHYNLPESLESYYQEAGRAGRNGNTAYAFILKKHIDEDHLKGQFLSTMPSIDFVKHVYNKLCNYFQISYGEGEHTVHQLNFKDFCNAYQLKRGLTYNTLRLLDRNSIIALNQQFNYKTKIQFLVSNTVLFQYIETHKQHNLVIKSLLRTYGGIFDFPTKINLDIIVNKANCSEKQLIAILKDLERQEIISLDIANTDSEITFIKPREDDKTINPIVKTVTQQQQLKHQQVNSVIQYINTNTVCRSSQLLNYFGESTKTDCGICNVCQASTNNTSNTYDISKMIVNKLDSENLSSRQLMGRLKYSEKEILEAITYLMERNIIKITTTNTYQLI